MALESKNISLETYSIDGVHQGISCADPKIGMELIDALFPRRRIEKVLLGYFKRYDLKGQVTPQLSYNKTFLFYV